MLRGTVKHHEGLLNYALFRAMFAGIRLRLLLPRIRLGVDIRSSYGFSV